MIHNAAGNFISPTERLSANAFQTIIDIVLKVYNHHLNGIDAGSLAYLVVTMWRIRCHVRELNVNWTNETLWKLQISTTKM